MSAEAFFDQETGAAVEGPHWAPPVAPMEMPHQVLEAPLRLGLPMWLARLLRPVQHG